MNREGDGTHSEAGSLSRNEELYVAGHRILADARLKPLLTTLVASLKPRKVQSPQSQNLHQREDNHNVNFKTTDMSTLHSASRTEETEEKKKRRGTEPNRNQNMHEQHMHLKGDWAVKNFFWF